MNEAIVAAMFTFLGLIITRVLDYTANRGKQKIDYETVTRDEMRKEVALLREEIARVRAESHEWQKKYYDLYGEHVKLQAEHTALQQDYAELKVYLKQQGISVPGLLSSRPNETLEKMPDAI